MTWIVDGANLLGRLGRDRESVEEKRSLLRALAAVGRRTSRRVTCVFDGTRPEAFAVGLGSLQAIFSAPRTADDVIVELVQKRAAAGMATIVTSDRGLAARVAGRKARIVSCEEFRVELEREAESQQDTKGDWEGYFSDPKNRNVF